MLTAALKSDLTGRVVALQFESDTAADEMLLTRLYQSASAAQKNQVIQIFSTDKPNEKYTWMWSDENAEEIDPNDVIDESLSEE